MVNFKEVDWKVYSSVVGILLLCILALFLHKVFFFLVIVFATALVGLILRFLQPLKYLGIELVTLSTMVVGAVYGPIIGGLYAFTLLLTHLILGDYYIGTFLVWIIPEYILLGVLSGIFGSSLLGPLGVLLIVGLNSMSLFFTLIGETERFGKEMPYAIGNTIINSILFIQFFSTIVHFIS